MSVAIVLPSEIGFGKEREVQTLLTDPWRKLVLIRLRKSARLADHSARVPITIHAVLGKGTLGIGEEIHPLSPGVIIPIDAQVEHHVQADPELAILVTFFRQLGQEAGNETTARFD